MAMTGVSRKSLLVGINEFLDESIVLPPGDWNNRDLLPLHILQTKSKAIRNRRIKKQTSFVQPPSEPTVPPIIETSNGEQKRELDKGRIYYTFHFYRKRDRKAVQVYAGKNWISVWRCLE